MKKFFSFFLLTVMIVSLSLSASAAKNGAFSCKIMEGDISGSNNMFYLSRCLGHYDSIEDAVTLYITNTSEHDISFEIAIGWSKSTVETSIYSGLVLLSPGVTGKFVLTGLREVPEKANDDLGYVPNSHLSENSVIRVTSQNVAVGDTYILSGLTQISEVRNSAFKPADPEAVTPTDYDEAAIAGAALVVKDPETVDSESGITAEVPDLKTVDIFCAIVIGSAILCAGGLILYVFDLLNHRRKKA